MSFVGALGMTTHVSSVDVHNPLSDLSTSFKPLAIDNSCIYTLVDKEVACKLHLSCMLIFVEGADKQQEEISMQCGCQ